MLLTMFSHSLSSAVSRTHHARSTRVERQFMPAVSNPSNETIASYVEAGIWGVILLLIVASLPRALMRWRHPSIRHQGLRLQASKPGVTTGTPKSRAYQTGSMDSMAVGADRAGDPDRRAEEAPVALAEGTVTPTTYSRVASWGSVFYPIYRHLERPVWWVGYSVGLSLAFATYTGLISFGIFYHNLPNFDPKR